MAADERNQISDLYHAVLARPAGDRDVFLNQACAGDETLRRELESLLRYESKAPGFLETPAAGARALPSLYDVTQMVGRELGPYRILAPLGQGGMGVVYRAHDSKLGRDVAIKILPQHLTEYPERQARFAREARVLATLNHSNIGAIYGVEEADGVTALVLELVEGTTLAERLERGPLPIFQVLAMARQIADALEAAHAKGIVHRDLKPANIVLQGGMDASDVRAKVVDFGLAKSTGVDLTIGPLDSERVSRHDTADGRILGTPAYMSPEQARGLPVDKRTDVWAFGCVLFEMLSGRPPFEATSATETIAPVLQRDPDWSALPATVPEPVRRLLRRCLQKDPAQRVRDIRDAMLDLDETVSSESAERPHRRTGNTATRTRVALMVAAVTAVAAAVWWSWSKSVPTPAAQPTLHLNVDLAPEASLGSEILPVVAISPNGERLVFISDRHLLTRRLEDSAAVSLDGTGGASSFFFSPDSKSVAFVADRTLKRVTLDGGSIARICDIPPGGLRGGSWGEDNTIVFATIEAGLSRVSAEGGSVEPLTRLAEGEYTHRWPQFLPGAKAVLFTSHAYPNWFDRARIDALSLVDGRRKTVQTDASFGRFVVGPNGTGYLVFVRAGTMFAAPFDPVRVESVGPPFPVLEHFAYSPDAGSAALDFSRTGTLVYRHATSVGLTWLESSGSTRPVLPGSANYMETPTLSPDGNRIAFSLGDDLWVYDLQRKMRTQVTTGIGAAGPVWTPDGRFILFSTFDNIAWIPADGGSEPKLLLPVKSSVVRYPTSIYETTHDRRLAFMQNDVGGNQSWDIWTVPVGIDSTGLHASEPEPFLRTKFDERHLTFSRDGRWVAYSSNESGARHEIYVRRFPSDGRRWKVSDSGGIVPQWSSDRRHLFFQSLDRLLMVAPYSATANAFTPGEPRAWSEQPMLETFGPRVYSVSRDGTRVAALIPDATSQAQSRHVVTLWTNILEEFRRRSSIQRRH